MRPTLFLSALAALSLAACDTVPTTPPSAAVPPGVVSAHGLLRAVGNRVVGRDGQPVSLAGISYGWSQWEAARFFNTDTVNWLKSDWHAAIIRAPLGIHEEAGYFQDPMANKARVMHAVDAALAADLYVLIDWHDHNAHLHTEQSIAFFTEMAKRYGDRPNIIYEIYNEPKAGYTWAKDVKPYAEKVIAAIRAIDPDNLIIVGTPNWSQDVDAAAADPVKDANIAYSLHFYAGTHKQKLRDKAAKALRLGAPLFITEWGTCAASGDGPIDDASVKEWLAFIRDNQLCFCNWAVYDKHETAALVLPSAGSNGGWTEADLSPSGKYVRSLVRDWPQ